MCEVFVNSLLRYSEDMSVIKIIGILLTTSAGPVHASPQGDSGCNRLEADRQAFASAPKTDAELLGLLSKQVSDLATLKTIKPGYEFPKSMYDRCISSKSNFIDEIVKAIRGKTTYEFYKEMLRYGRVIENLKAEILYLEKSYEVKPDKTLLLEWWQAWVKLLNSSSAYTPDAALADTKKVMGTVLANQELSPKQKAYALQERAQWLRKKDALELAIKDYNSALSFDPAAFLALVSVGSYYIDRSQFQDALKIFKRMEQQQPENLDIQKEILKCESALGHWAESVARVEKNNFYPNLTLSLQLKYVEGLLKLNRVEKADSLLSELKLKKPEILKMKEFQAIEGLKAYLRAEAFEKRGLVANAFGEYAQAVKLQPKNPDFRYRAALYIYKIHEERKFEKTPAFKKDMRKAMEFLQMPVGVSDTEAIRNLKAKLGAFGL